MNTKIALMLAALLGGMGSLTVCDAQRTYEMPSPEEMPQPDYAPPPLQCSEADSYQYFYQPLTSYGTWIHISPYGYCWRPSRISVGWRPYWDGRWVWTNCGWTWVTDEPWGWACYHYGRWVRTAECGWVWMPGREWAPAWVSWRRGPDFVAWAPLAPGVSIGFGFAGDALAFEVGWWTCVPFRDFLAPHCSRVAFSSARCRELLPRATAVVNVTTVNNIVVNPGPSRRFVQAATGRTVPVHALHSINATSSARSRIAGNTLIVATPSATAKPRPPNLARVQRLQNVTVIKTEADAQRVARSASSAHATTFGSPAQPGAVKAQPAYPEKRVRQKPEKIRTPETVSPQPATVRAQPAQPERVAPTTRAPKGTTGTQMRKGYPKERPRPERQVQSPSATPKRVSPPPTTSPAPQYRKPETPKSVEPKHVPPAVAPSVTRPAIHPPAAPPPQSRGGKEKGKPNEKSKE